jgi:SAM-dependent methyltransferase
MDIARSRWDQTYKSQTMEDVPVDDWLNRYSTALSHSKDTPVIDLGCGLGRDTSYLCEKGYKVIACDYSKGATDFIKRNFPGVETKLFDMRYGLPFADASAKAVIADLSLHYFPWDQTREIVTEIFRVLQAGGILLCRLNSMRDLHYGAGSGEEIEKHYYLKDGIPKRFFSREDVVSLFDGWEVAGMEEKPLAWFSPEKIGWEASVRKEGKREK